MKLKAMTVLAFLMMASTSLKAQKVTIHLKDVPIEKVFSEITKQTGRTFAFTGQVLNVNENVSVSANQEELAEVLSKLFRDSKIAYEISDNKIFLVDKSIEPGQTHQNKKHTKTYTGIVYDQNNEPIIGASVVVKADKAIGTITNYDGEFKIEAPENEILTISYMGYISENVKLGANQDLKIYLSEDSRALDEVVVVGYGVQTKRDVTTSISSLKASEVEHMAVTSIEQALTGQLSGVQISEPNGTPGAGFNVKIRGAGSITAGTSPLYVVDGVPLSDDAGAATGMAISPLSSLDMGDIESIEVLKDASAAAIYGSRGSNGVVIITTKKGNEGKAIIKYNGYAGFQNTTKKIKVLDAYQYSQLVFEGHNAAYYDQLAQAGKEHLYNPWATNQERWDNLRSGKINLNQGWMMVPEVLPYLQGGEGLVNTDWQDEVLRTGFKQRHNISIGGGNKDIRYFISGNYQDEEGVVENSDYAKMGFRSKVDLDYTKWRLGANINVARNIYKLVNSEGRYGDDGVLSLALGAAPIFPVYTSNGEYDYQQNNTSYGNAKLNNPVAVAKLIKDKMYSLQLLSSGYIEFLPTSELVFRMQGSLKYDNFYRNYYRPGSLPNSTDRLPPSNPTAESRTKNKYTWVWETTASYQKTINDHYFSALLGWSAEEFVGTGNRVTATDLPKDDLLEMIPGNATATKYDSWRNAYALLSAIGRVQYNYQSKYIASATMRTDGSSRFGKDNRWGYFPSLSGAWYITQEDFMKPYSSLLSNLKLRTSWGITGNMNIGDYAHYGLVDGINYIFGNQSAIGMKEKTAGNSHLGWEKTSQVNLGLEIGLFNWLNAEVDIYQGDTRDMLLEVPVMEASGFSTVLQNIGKVRNKGIEITLSTNAKIGRIKWTNKINYAANRNKVLSLGDATEIITQSNSVIDFITKVGEPIGNYYTYVTDGVYKNQEEIDADIANGIIVPGAKPGDFRFKKFGNSSSTINAEDKAITGNYTPKFIYGYSTGFFYNSFDLNISLQGVYGNKIANINKRYLANMEGNANQLIEAKDRWQSVENPGNGKVYRANRTPTGMNSVVSTWHIEDGSYMRIRDITLGYRFSKKWLRNVGISDLRVYCSAFNPFTFTKYTGYNPEVSKDTSPIMQGVDYGTYPLAKSFIFGLNFTL